LAANSAAIEPEAAASRCCMGDAQLARNMRAYYDLCGAESMNCNGCANS
jgi:hypothetical protein